MADPRAVYERIERRVHSAPRPCARRLPHDDGRRLGGRQIVSKRYISNIRQHPSSLDDIPFVPTPGSPSTAGSGSPKFYAHLWWTNATGAALGAKVPRDAYHARGFRENLLIVVPSLSMVVVRTGSNPESLKEFQYVHVAGYGCGRHDTLG